MIQIAGGTYFENCIEPPWSELYGSGLRASVALADLSASVHLATYIGNADSKTLEAVCQGFGIHLVFKRSRETISFDYLYSLSKPRISPDTRTITRQQALTVEGEAILRFGFMEGDAIVKGERVVYDPQSPSNPLRFFDNGSSATHLAVVCNLPEASILAGLGLTDDHRKLGLQIIESHGAEVVVIKNGTLGCSVITRSEFGRIPAFKTEFIWKIGSGDVFAALFAHFWAEKKESPLEAASQASVGTAHYCSSMVLPIRRPLISAKPLLPVAPMERIPKRTVYLAGPFFNLQQRWLIEEARSALMNQGVLVFSPVHDVGRGPAHSIYEPDIEGIKKCDLMLACLDGLDAGTLFEIGYARAIQKPVVVYTTTAHSEDLKMPEGSGCTIVKDFTTAIYKAVWTALSV